MTRYVSVRMTVEQAQAASNACDLLRDQCEADGFKRQAALYQRACAVLDDAVRPHATRLATSHHSIDDEISGGGGSRMRVSERSGDDE